MSKKFIVIMSGLLLMLSAPTHVGLADAQVVDDKVEAMQSQPVMAPLRERDYYALPTLIEKLETPKIIRNVFFGDISVKERLNEFYNQDPISQISTVFSLGKSLYDDIQLLSFAHKIAFTPTDNAQAQPMIDQSAKPQTLIQRIETELEKIAPFSTPYMNYEGIDPSGF